MNAPDVTIVVCTYNRAERLPAALGSLAALVLGGRTAEVLVVDNNSTDETPAVVDRIAVTSPVPMRRVFEGEQGIVPARNRGIAEARGRWVAFFDDDQLAEPGWIAELLSLAERRAARCVGGAVTLRLPDQFAVDGLSPVVRMLLGETVGRDHERPYDHRFTPGCGNLLVERTLFEEVGVFDPALANRGEDTDLWMRIRAAGYAGWYTPRAVVRHVIPTDRLTADYLLRLSDVMAEGMAEDEREAWGAWYPAIWLARVGQLAGVLWPRRVWASITGNVAASLGARCRLRIARGVVADGWGLMTTRTRRPSAPAEHPPSARPATGAVRSRGGTPA